MKPVLRPDEEKVREIAKELGKITNEANNLNEYVQKVTELAMKHKDDEKYLEALYFVHLYPIGKQKIDKLGFGDVPFLVFNYLGLTLGFPEVFNVGVEEVIEKEAKIFVNILEGKLDEKYIEEMAKKPLLDRILFDTTIHFIYAILKKE